jgi:Holliday junction resolvase-like predicted endonuclease
VSVSKKFSKFELRAERALVSLGWIALYHNIEILGVQVDLLMRSPSGVLSVVEVKTQGRFGMAHLSPAQRRRLFRVVALLSGWEPVELQLALVSGAKVLVLPVDGLTGC